MSDHYRDQHRTVMGHFIKRPNKGIFKKPEEASPPAPDDEAKKSRSFASWVKKTAGGT